MTTRKRANAASQPAEAEAAETKRSEADRRNTAEAETSAPVKWRPRVRTADSDDASLGWTVQKGDIKPEDSPQEPGQVLRPEQLPDPVEQRAVGVDPVEWATNGTVYLDRGDGNPTPYVP